jgi:hypothetical protein
MQKESQRLRKAVQKLELEKALLKRASSFFARELKWT